VKLLRSPRLALPKPCPAVATRTMASQLLRLRWGMPLHPGAHQTSATLEWRSLGGRTRPLLAPQAMHWGLPTLQDAGAAGGLKPGFLQLGV